MTAGVPGISLGGMYYILLCGWISVRNRFLQWRGEAPMPASAMRIRRHARLAVGMLLALWGTLRLMRIVLPRFLPPLPDSATPGFSARMLDSAWFSVPWLVGLAALMLAGLFAVLWLLQRLFPLSEAQWRPMVACTWKHDKQADMARCIEE